MKKDKDHYRVVVMGSAQVGKTAIISQFLYDTFVPEYKETVEELHRGEYEISGHILTLDILDTSGAYEFPAMRKLSICNGDAFILVYSVDNYATFEEVKTIREQVLEHKPENVPIVIVGNKLDLEEVRRVPRETAETLATIEWNNGFSECSAKENHNILGVFKELLYQSNVSYALSPAVKKRRESLPNFRDKPGESREKPAKTGKRNSCAIS